MANGRPVDQREGSHGEQVAVGEVFLYQGGAKGKEDQAMWVGGELGSRTKGAGPGLTKQGANREARNALRDCQVEVLFGKLIGHGVKLGKVVQSGKGEQGVLMTLDMDQGDMNGEKMEEGLTSLDQICLFA